MGYEVHIVCWCLNGYDSCVLLCLFVHVSSVCMHVVLWVCGAAAAAAFDAVHVCVCWWVTLW
jgi:hypothetical protein